MQRGFSLIEVAVSFIIASVVAAAALSLHSSMVTMLAQEGRISQLAARMMATNQYLIREFSSIGGNGATASTAIFVTDDCPAVGGYPKCVNGSDRVTIFSAVANMPLCRISHADVDAEGLKLSFWFRDKAGVSQCCFNDERNGSRAQGGPKTQYLRRSAMMVLEELHRPVLLTADHNGDGVVGAPAPDNYAAFGDSRDRDGDGDGDSQCTFRVEDLVAASQRATPLDDAEWVGGVVSIVDMRTLYIDNGGDIPRLMLHTDLDSNGGGLAPTLVNAGTPAGPHSWLDPLTPPADETIVISEGVYDLQVALGYDLDKDGVVAADEWTHDVSGEARDFSVDSRLRLIRFDVAQGVRLSSSSLTANRPRSPMNPTGPTPIYANTIDVYLRASSVEVSPRNQDGIVSSVP